MCKVSIIVPVYNAEKYLNKCINSIINQRYSNIEIILINDGSLDNSLQICQEFAQKDNRIKVVDIKNSGVSTARNIGIESSTGEYITFVDSDDWVEPNMIEISLNEAIISKADIVIWSCFKNYPDREESISIIPGGDQLFTTNKNLLLLKSIYQFYGMDELTNTVSSGTTWGKLYKSELIKKNNIKFQKGLIRSQDVIFSLESFSKAKTIKYLDRKLYHYRINESSISSGNRYIHDTVLPFNSLLMEMKKFSSFIDNTTVFNEAFNARTIQVILWHLDHNYFHPSNQLNLFEKRKKVRELINSQPYKTALTEVKFSLLPQKERLLVRLFRRNMIISFDLINKLHNRYITRKSKKFE